MRKVGAFLLLAAAVASAQMVVEPTDRARFNGIFDHTRGDTLDCDATAFRPFVDFGFRFELGYVVDCDLRQFAGQAGELRTYLRARPEGAAEAILTDEFNLPSLPKDATIRPDFRHMRTRIEFSEAFAVGAGQYKIDLLVIDNRERAFRHSWKVKAFPHGDENKVALSLAPGSVANLRATPLPQKTGADGPRITVMVNAAPLNPYALKLRAWDRVFLLDALSSLLRELRDASVRVVAFNLDQQREIYRRDDFGQAQFGSLARTLRNLELGSISYATLERRSSGADLLLGLLQEERSADAVIILGPMGRVEEKMPHEMLASYSEAAPRLFCFAYYPRYGAEFPDSIQQLTAALKGKVFRVHTPGDLAQNIAKLKREMEASNLGVTRAQK